MSRFTAALRAVPGLMRVGFASAIAYRAEFIVWVLAYSMPVIMLALWTAVAREAPVGRFGEREFQAYFLATLVLRLAAGAWVVWDLNMEVRLGTLQRRLMWPIHTLLTYLTENVAALPMRMVFIVPVAGASLFWLGTGVITDDPVQLWLVVPSLVGAFLINFFTMAIIGTFSLWWESSMALYDLWLGLYTVLSGYVMPLELFPPDARRVVQWLPFRQMLAFPVENALGLISREQALRDLAVQWAYVALFGWLAHLVWRAGVRRFAAFGG